MSVSQVRPGHPLVHEAPERNYEPLLVAMIVAIGVVLVAVMILGMFAIG